MFRSANDYARNGIPFFSARETNQSRARDGIMVTSIIMTFSFHYFSHFTERGTRG